MLDKQSELTIELEMENIVNNCLELARLLKRAEVSLSWVIQETQHLYNCIYQTTEKDERMGPGMTEAMKLLEELRKVNNG